MVILYKVFYLLLLVEMCIKLQGKSRDVDPSCCIRVQTHSLSFIGFSVVTFATECQINTMCDFDKLNLITWCFIVLLGGNIYGHEGGGF